MRGGFFLTYEGGGGYIVGMIRCFIRYGLLLLLHVFLVGLWVDLQGDLWTAVNLLFHPAQRGESLNLLMPVALLLLLWLIPVLIRRTDASVAWGSLGLFSLGFILMSIAPFNIEGQMASQVSEHGVSQNLDVFAFLLWGLISSCGMLFAIYLRGTVASLHARHAARAPWCAALCQLGAVSWIVVVFTLMIAVSGVLSKELAELTVLGMWVRLLIVILLCSFFVLTVSARRIRLVLLGSLLGVVALMVYTLVVGDSRRLEFIKVGTQWVCIKADQGERDDDPRVRATEMIGPHDHLGVTNYKDRVELVMERDGRQDQFSLNYMQTALKKDRSVRFDGYGARGEEMTEVTLTVIDRPGVRWAQMLLLIACGMLLLGRALRAAPEGLPRRR